MSSLSNGGTGVDIYICNNSTLTIPVDFNAASGTRIIIMPGSVLNVNGNYNGGTAYVYGTLNAAGVSLQNTGANIYVAQSGIWNATSSTINLSGGSAVVEGTANLNILNQFQNGTTQFCVNNDGCVQFNSSTAGAVQLDDKFITDAGVGYIYWNSTTCPAISNSNTFTASPNLKICTAQTNPSNNPTSTQCPFWGAATVKWGCVPGAGGTGTSANCAGARTLPSILAYLNTDRMEHGVKISWGTVSQKNSLLYVIEKSLNGIDWEEVDRVSAKGNSSTFTEYALFDGSPTVGTNYYRLKEIDYDGKTHLYGVEVIEITVDASSYLIYPNPSKGGKVTVETPDEFPKYDLEVYAATGQFVKKIILKPGKNDVDTGLQPGVYIAKLKIGSGGLQKELVIQ